MSNPVFISLDADTWTLVAEGVVAGSIWAQKSGTYVQTFVNTGDPAPVNDDTSGAGPVHGGPAQEIRSAFAVDVYIKCRGGAGRVRVDLRA